MPRRRKEVRTPGALPGGSRLHAVLLVAILLASLALRMRFVSVPLERDEGEYAYIAWRMNEGDIPYKDAFDQKPPGISFVYLAIMKLFGFTTEAIHIGMTIWSMGTIALLALAGRKLFSQAAGLIGAAAFSVASISPAFTGTAANTEIFMTLPLAGAACLAAGLLEGKGGERAVFLCGLLSGLATTFKQVSAAEGAFFALAIAVAARRAGAGPRKLAVSMAAFAGGLLLP